MKKTELELKKTFKRKIAAIEKFLNLASQEKLLSDERKETLALIAVELRALFCYSSGKPLISNANMTSEMIFPLYDRLTPFNELSDFILVANHCTDHHCTFEASTTIALDGSQVPSTWLSYHSWINQIVIDLKNEGYPPLTRADAIRILADKDGAHVDTEIHPFVELINTTNILPFSITIGNQECTVDCSNLICETIFSIAKEAVYSYKYLNKPPILWERESRPGFKARVYDYSDEEKKRYKYTICTDAVRVYSTNRVFPCKISEHPIKTYDLLFKSRTFPVEIIRVEDYVL